MNHTIQLHIPSFGYSEDILFHDVRLNANLGDMIGVYGPSGIGKTTLLKMIGCIIKPAVGTVSYEGDEIFAWSAQQRAYYRNTLVGFSFQDYNLLEGLSVRDNILLPSTIGKHTIDTERMDYLITTLELGSLLEKRVAQLSGGEVERVSLIKSLIHKPRILLCDEPGSSLHHAMKHTVYTLLRDYCRDAIGIIVSHDHEFTSYTTAIYDMEEFAA